MQTTTTCPTCNGEGKTITKKCPHCNGEGIVSDEEIITIKIPAGVAEGMQLSMQGRGNAARRGGINGDLLVVIEEEEDPNLIRDDNDVIYNLFLSFPTAALGGTVEVPTIDGVAKVKIDPGTQPGKVLRLRNKGLPSVNGFGTGDELIHVNVYVPENLNDKERKWLQEMDKSENFEPSKSAKKSVFNKFKKMFD
jgi:molecular chaperone DnaJ